MKIPRSPFWVGFFGHLVFWLLVVNLDSTPMDFDCGETSCWALIAAELPFSVFYISGSGMTFLAGSLLVGSCWWGLLAFAVSRIPVGGSDWPARRLRLPSGIDDRPPKR